MEGGKVCGCGGRGGSVRKYIYNANNLGSLFLAV